MDLLNHRQILFVVWLLLPKSMAETTLLCSAQSTILEPPTLQASSRDAEPVTNTRELLKVPRNSSGHGNMIRMTCTAPYPIELVHERGKMEENGIANHLGELIQVYYSNFSITATHIFYIHVDFRIHHHNPRVSNLSFRCHSIQNRCLQQTVVYQVPLMDDGEDWNQLTFSVSDNKGPVPALDPLSDFSPVDKEADDCEAIFYFEEVDHVVDIQGLGGAQKIPSFAFRCEFEDGTPGKLNKRYCFTDVSDCSSVLRGKRQPKHCVKPLIRGKTCVTCITGKEDYFVPFVATCEAGSRKSRNGNIFIFGMPQDGQRPNIYFANEEVSDPSSMIFMNKFNAMQILHTDLTVTCTSSYYFNVASFQFALQLGSGNDSIVEYVKPRTEESDTNWELRLNSKSQTMTLKLDRLDITRIFCFGGTQRAFHWNSASRPVKIIDPLATLTSPTTKSSILQKIESRERTKDKIQINPPKTTPPMPIPMLIEKSGTSWMEILIVVVPIIVVLILIFVTVVTILCHQNRKQRRALRNLTADEVRDFRQGNPSIDPNDVHASIHGTPFNPSLEIPRELLIFDENNVLGSGQYGVVLLGSLMTPVVAGKNSRQKEMATATTVAVKTVRRNVEVSHFKALLSEIKILAYIGQHENIACMLGACTTDIEKRQVLAAIEFCGHGNLLNFIVKRRHSFQNQFPGLLTSNEFFYANVDAMFSTQNDQNDGDSSFKGHLTSMDLVKWSRDICNGMVYLSQKKVIHGDLALRNVLLTNTNVAKISDFGLSHQLVDYSNYVLKQQIPLPFKWLSIEALTNMEFSVQSDCWSFGITLWELFSLGVTPYPGYVWNHDFLEQLMTGYRMKCPPQASKELYDLMLDCWNRVPKDRPSFNQVYERLENILENLTESQ